MTTQTYNELEDRKIAFENRDELLELIAETLEASNIPVKKTKRFGRIELEVHWRDRVMTIDIGARRYPSLDFDDDIKQGEIFRANRKKLLDKTP